MKKKKSSITDTWIFQKSVVKICFYIGFLLRPAHGSQNTVIPTQYLVSYTNKRNTELKEAKPVNWVQEFSPSFKIN